MNKQLELNVTGIPNELRVILEMVKRDNDETIRLNSKEWFTDMDWDLFLELAMHHRLFPILFPKLKLIDKKWIPEHIVQSLYQQYRNNTFRMLQLSGEMEQLSRFFSEKQIRLLILKGPVLASDLYGDLSLRTCGDLDMMVSIQDVEKVDQFLSNLAYEKDDYIETVLGDWKWRHHHVTYFHSQKPIKIEVHWRLNPGPGFEPNFEQLWERKRVSSLTSFPVFYLGREDLFLFLVTHGARHGWSRLRWLTDIDQILQQEINWIELKKRMKDYHFSQISGQALILASELLNSNLTEEAILLTRSKRSKKLAQKATFYFEHMVNLHSFPVPEDVAVYHKKHLFSLMSPQQKLLFILSFLYPYPEDAETLHLPKPFHFLYFPLRPILWAWRKIMKQAFRKRRTT